MPNDIIGNTFPQAWNKLPDMVKTLSKLLKKKTLKNSKLEKIIHLPVIYVTTNDDPLRKRRKKISLPRPLK